MIRNQVSECVKWSKSQKFTDNHSQTCDNTFTALGTKILKSVKMKQKWNINSLQNNVNLLAPEFYI